jgi:cell division protein FtsA
MVGRRFGIDMQCMTADIAVVRNLILAIERCHLEVGALVAGAYAAGLAVLADDEADLGAALVDMGAGRPPLRCSPAGASCTATASRSADITSRWISRAD